MAEGVMEAAARAAEVRAVVVRVVVERAVVETGEAVRVVAEMAVCVCVLGWNFHSFQPVRNG